MLKNASILGRLIEEGLKEAPKWKRVLGLIMHKMPREQTGDVLRWVLGLMMSLIIDD